MQGQPFDQELTATFEAIKRRRPVYSDLVDTFHDLLQAQAVLAKRFSGQDFDFPDQDPDRSRQGVSYLSDAGLPGCREQIETACETLLPIIETSFPFPDQTGKLAGMIKDGELDVESLARAFLLNDPAPITAAAEKAGVDGPVLAFVVRAALSPVLAGMAKARADELEKLTWLQGYCPFCGGAPAIATLSKFLNPRKEELVGGGGKKHLTCSLCSHEWAFRRDCCPACGETDHNQREIIFAEDAQHERIEACKKCGSYLLCIDLREVDGDPRMEAAPLGLVHLDLIARKRNYAPLADMPWSLDE